jgi:hypothetical protein
VDGEIRIALGKCLRLFACVELLFGVPAAGVVALSGLPSPISVWWVLAFGVAQAMVGWLVGRSGRRARRRTRILAVNVAIERATRLG